MRKQKVVLSCGRDMPMLMFLWRWKLATTRSLHARFFRNCGLYRAYARLWQIARAGYLTTTPIERTGGSAWSLTKQGFLAIREELPSLREEGFASECSHHDLVCAALHLGDWLCEQPDNVSLFSEQQLRRYESEMCPKWVPLSTAHRPDGYTLVKDQAGDRIVALEVELNRKTAAAYRAAGIFYSHERSIDRVLWLIGRESHADDLESHLSAYDSRRPSIHNFVSLDRFRESGWSTAVVRGPERGATIRTLFDARAPRTKPEQSPNTCSALLFLDTRKRSVESARSTPA